ncbi:VOC family protein [Alicyclobacillus acidoterrestris]|uniref:VOC family protein n=1 Tax=Alicyclobacillus acidoterrestris (strain ATCC 49025 / DSM 3922 / CIP 106132 / NCIMB 13137 / GD3B) TaxID=1356854 RepID=T0DNC0_ALIAG|nr:VOC family protein [Alicyclobacillus acidoterrestris]EPZ52867.1 glyoxalase [Alicyclobacillus acidoterrestris ATCC 49025]UNO48864.1 VOC family protein [Alicyclobacillus acidoterrestris]
MRDMNNVFHLAIPARDLDEAYTFYVEKLGCKLARRYADRITLDFFGDQVVCHLSQDYDQEPKMYPRHFGVTFRDRTQFDNLYKLAKQREIPFFHDMSLRFEGLIEEHLTFFLIDPSNNLLEFKYYHDERMMY